MPTSECSLCYPQVSFVSAGDGVGHTIIISSNLPSVANQRRRRRRSTITAIRSLFVALAMFPSDDHKAAMDAIAGELME